MMYRRKEVILRQPLATHQHRKLVRMSQVFELAFGEDQSTLSVAEKRERKHDAATPTKSGRRRAFIRPPPPYLPAASLERNSSHSDEPLRNRSPVRTSARYLSAARLSTKLVQFRRPSLGTSRTCSERQPDKMGLLK